jgi:hypothetical protein
MKIKVAELEGAKLDMWMAKAENVRFSKFPERAKRLILPSGEKYSPSSDWSQGGPIIEREKIMLEPVETWCAHLYTGDPAINYAVSHEGKTPLEAAMRCYVASKFGEEVEEA